MDIKKLKEMALENKSAIEEAAAQNKKIAREEKLNRIINAVASKAMNIALSENFQPKWMKKEAAQLEADVRTFINEGEGQPLVEYVENGCGIFFGANGKDYLAIRDFGTYRISLEKGLETARFPKVIKINVRANTKLAKVLKSRLGIEEISMFGIDEILMAEKFGKVNLRFVPVDEIPDEAEMIELATTSTVIGKETQIDVAVVAAIYKNEVLVTRSDWYGESCLPAEKTIVFNMRHVVHKLP